MHERIVFTSPCISTNNCLAKGLCKASLKGAPSSLSPCIYVMAPIATADLAARAQDNTPVENEDLLISDDLLKARAEDKNQIPLLCFPRSERGVTDYDEFTGQDLDRMVDHAAKHYLQSGLRPVGFACNTFF